MAVRETENVVVLTQVGRYPRPEEFDSDPDGALERLQREALRVHAEALTCLSQIFGSIVGDCDFDRERFAAVLRRAAELRDLTSSLQSKRIAASAGACAVTPAAGEPSSQP